MKERDTGLSNEKRESESEDGREKPCVRERERVKSENKNK